MLFLVDWLFGMATTVVAFVMAFWRIQSGVLSLGEGVTIIILSIELARPLNLISTFFFGQYVQNEREIQATIQTLMKGRTTMIIAHRLSAISDVDEILVLEKGQVAERGTHEELLAKNEVYARLFAEQENEIKGL